jgi:dATP pyrophosphohydrolase
VREETGIDAEPARFADWRVANAFEIYAHWRGRFAPGTTHNTEHVFSLEVPAPIAVTLAPEEHRAQQWLPWEEAAERCFSWSNRDAIRMLPARRARA